MPVAIAKKQLDPSSLDIGSLIINLRPFVWDFYVQEKEYIDLSVVLPYWSIHGHTSG